MKSNAQLRCEDQDEDPQLPRIHVEMSDIASSSQATLLPPQQDAVSAQIFTALASLQGA
jgi:hypothetical protein